jgi:SAM-dependent methyltransferase
MATILTSIDVALEPRAAFDSICAELSSALERLGMRFDTGPGGTVTAGPLEIARVVSWTPGERVVLEWHPATWDPATTTTLELRVEPHQNGALITVEIGGWERVVREPGELAGWFGSEVAAPLLQRTSPSALGDWLTDRLARRPSGASSCAVYRDPLYHYPNFQVILQELALTADDYLLEVGCGGGALLKAALRSGCRAAAVDHSHEMVRLARAENADAVAAGRLDVREARADSLPFPDGTFTCATMTGVLGFLADPVAALAEMRRVLAPGGRIVVLGSDPELKGTPGAPEPMASRLQFYTEDELERLGREAGFDDVNVIRRDLEPYAREAGVPEEHLCLFAGKDNGARFLLARKRYV